MTLVLELTPAQPLLPPILTTRDLIVSPTELPLKLLHRVCAISLLCSRFDVKNRRRITLTCNKKKKKGKT